MTTIARPNTTTGSHWYKPDGTPCYELPKKDGSGMKTPTLADAKKLGLLPSVTTILKILAKPELQAWIVEQAVLSVLTTPRKPGETDDVFVQRVLHDEKIQDQEAQVARDRGVELHAALEDYFQGREIAADLRPWIMPAAEVLRTYGEPVTTEKILVGPGYAGKTDLIIKAPEAWWIWDFKTAKKLPEKGAWKEHVLQCAAYAKAFDDMSLDGGRDLSVPTRTGNVYISTTEQGTFTICEHGPWEPASAAFDHLVSYWQFANSYIP